jgi:hypothetical protein
MKDITVLLYWTNTREITSYWFDVKSAPISNSYLTYVQFAAGIMSYFLFHGIKLYCSINTHFSFDVFYAIINLKIVNFYKPWSNMKILMLFHDFDVIGLLFHDFDVIRTVIPWFWRHRSVNHVILLQTIYNHGSYSWTYLNQLILRIRWFK